MCEVDSDSFANFSVVDEGAVCAEIGECVSIALFRDGAVSSAEPFVVDADDAFGISADEYF
jgi:hypothetical protein